jgi:hypothetical protein
LNAKRNQGQYRFFPVALLLGVAAVWLFPHGACAAGAGEAAYAFLKVGTDARAEAMGGAYAGLADGLGALTYNPAGLGFLAPKQFMATYNNWLTDIQSGFVAGTWRLGENDRIGVAAQYLDYGNFRAARSDGSSRPDFGASDFALALSWGRSFSGQDDRSEAVSQSSVGGSVRLISESIDNQSSWALAFDAGFLYRFSDEHTQAGIAVRNAGFQMKAFGEGAKDKLPITGVAGFSHQLRGTPVLFAVDVMKSYDSKFGAAFGSEISAVKPLLLRVGYNTLGGQIDTGTNSDKLAGLSFGAGFTMNRVTIDYAFGLMSKLGSTHRFTLHTGF